MKAGELAGAVVESVIKVIVIAVVVIFVFRWASRSYQFGYRVFADEPVAVSEEGRIITVGVSKEMDIKDVSAMLQEKGLIEDQKLFVVQELLSAYHNDILPGMYDLNTNMTAEQMLEIMSTEVEKADDESEANAGTDSGTDASKEEPDAGINDGSDTGGALQ